MAILHPKGKDGRGEDYYSNQGFLFLELNDQRCARYRDVYRLLANRLLELGDLYLPGDEGLLLRAWFGGKKEIPLGDNREPLRFDLTAPELDRAFRGKVLRTHNTWRCIHEYIIPQLRRIAADDAEIQRLLTTAD